MAVSPSGTRLYVAELGINAIAVLDAKTLAVLGHIPTAWYPYRVALSPDGRQLVCICFRGFGNGPNAGRSRFPQQRLLGYAGRGQRARRAVGQRTGYPDGQRPGRQRNCRPSRGSASMSSPVIPTVVGQTSKEIKYVVFITKENHTFDTIFDRVPGTKHDPSLLRWGLHQTIRQKGQPVLHDVAVMVNHNASGAAVHPERQLLHGARSLRRRASLARGRAAEQPDADDLLGRLVLQEGEHAPRVAATPWGRMAR